MVLVAMFQMFVEIFYNHVKILGDYIKSKKEIYVNDEAQNRSLFCKKKKVHLKKKWERILF